MANLVNCLTECKFSFKHTFCLGKGSTTFFYVFSRIYILIKPLFVFTIFISYMLQFYIPAIIFGRLMLKIRWHREASDKMKSIHRKIMRVTVICLTCKFIMARLLTCCSVGGFKLKKVILRTTSIRKVLSYGKCKMDFAMYLISGVICRQKTLLSTFF